MELVRLRIPYAFIRDRVQLSWREILFGLTEELLDPAAPSLLAADLVGGDTEDATLIELAGLSPKEDSQPYVQTLAGRATDEPVPDGHAKWLYLVLAWIFLHRDEYADPLRAVEEVYADFGYPKQIANFVRYMPMEGPDLGSRKRNEARLYDRWQHYLQDAERRFGAERR